MRTAARATRRLGRLPAGGRDHPRWEELYDLQSDPFELQSRHNDPALSGPKTALGRLLDRLQAARGRGVGPGPAVATALDGRRVSLRRKTRGC